MAFVRVKELRKRFSELVAVDGVSFEIEQGHTLALLGPSGCGKTTILRCLAGLETGDSGSITIGDAPMFDRSAGIDLKPEERELGIVFQSYAVWPHMTVAQNVGFPLKVRGIGKAEIAARTSRVLDMVGLGAVRDKPATALSGGQQQRVALARALVHEPRLVLFDEPMSNLDAQLRARMRMELAVLQERLGFTAIYVTHDQAEAFSLAETVAVMNAGRIETIGDPRSVFARPQTPFVAEFLGLNVLRGKAVCASPCGDSAFLVDIAIGDGVRLRGKLRGEQPAEGASVLACIRKHHVAVKKDGAAVPRPDPAEAPDRQTVSGVVRAASFLGLEEELIVAVGGVEIGAIQPPRGLHAGEPVTITMAAEDCIVFVADGVAAGE